MPPVLELRSVSKHFPTHVAVRDVSLTIDRGKLFALLGPSGCGKTTTLRMVAGFEIPTSGQVLLNGSDIAPLPPYERNVTTVFQNYALFPHLTAKQNIEFGLRRKGAPDLDQKVAQVLDLVQMKGKEERKPARLSGGEKQRIALARALVLEPDVLLLDEPLSALDPKLRKQVRSELKALQRRVGITFIIVTHDQEEAMMLADEVALMHKGVIAQLGTPEDIYLRPANRFVANFLGAVNWLGEFGVRPEAIRITRDLLPTGDRCRPASVETVMFLGNSFHVQAKLSDGRSVVTEVSRLEKPFAPAERVRVWWNQEDEIHLPPESA
ncbi:MAG: ABC transporter ATP-binding protein [Acidobacteria bacterium]|nr:ABC transporter ATP-binding protein [Acidobacteriota bacterium]